MKRTAKDTAMRNGRKAAACVRTGNGPAAPPAAFSTPSAASPPSLKAPALSPWFYTSGLFAHEPDIDIPVIHRYLQRPVSSLFALRQAAFALLDVAGNGVVVAAAGDFAGDIAVFPG